MLRGGTSHIVEVEAFVDTLGVVSLVINEAQVLVGGGALLGWLRSCESLHPQLLAVNRWLLKHMLVP